MRVARPGEWAKAGRMRCLYGVRIRYTNPQRLCEDSVLFGTGQGRCYRTDVTNEPVMLLRCKPSTIYPPIARGVVGSQVGGATVRQDILLFAARNDHR